MAAFAGAQVGSTLRRRFAGLLRSPVLFFFFALAFHFVPLLSLCEPGREH
jgi:hypothetical protein